MGKKDETPEERAARKEKERQRRRWRWQSVVMVMKAFRPSAGGTWSKIQVVFVTKILY